MAVGAGFIYTPRFALHDLVGAGFGEITRLPVPAPVDGRLACDFSLGDGVHAAMVLSFEDDGFGFLGMRRQDVTCRRRNRHRKANQGCQKLKRNDHGEKPSESSKLKSHPATFFPEADGMVA